MKGKVTVLQGGLAITREGVHEVGCAASSRPDTDRESFAGTVVTIGADSARVGAPPIDPARPLPVVWPDGPDVVRLPSEDHYPVPHRDTAPPEAPVALLAGLPLAEARLAVPSRRSLSVTINGRFQFIGHDFNPTSEVALAELHMKRLPIRSAVLSVVAGTLFLLGSECGGVEGYPEIHICGDYTIARMTDGTIRQWGWGGSGYTPLIKVPSPLVKLWGVRRFGCGVYTRLAVDERGELWGWGASAMGALGEMTFGHEFVPIRFATAENIEQLAGGYEYSLALLTDGSVWMWGDVEAWGFDPPSYPGEPVRLDALDGSAKIYSSKEALSDSDRIVAIGRDGSVRELERGDPASPRVLSFPRPVVDVAVGVFHALAITDDGRVWSWGSNSSGALGSGDIGDPSAGVPAEYREEPAEVPLGNRVIAVAAGLGNSYALDETGNVWKWGLVEFKLVSGYLSPISRPYPVRFEELASVVAISAGRSRFFAVSADGAVWATGGNTHGEIGDGTTENHLVPVRVIGFGPDAPPSPLPASPAVEVVTEPGRATVTVEVEDVRDGVTLVYAPYPEGYPVSTLSLGEQRVGEYSLSSGSAYYVGAVISDFENGLGVTPLSNIEHFTVP